MFLTISSLTTIHLLLQIFLIWKIIQFCTIYIVPKNNTTDSRKITVIQEWLVVESCPTPRLVHKILSHFNELILAQSAYLKQVFWKKSVFYSLYLRQQYDAERPWISHLCAYFKYPKIVLYMASLLCQIWSFSSLQSIAPLRLE